MATPKKPRRAHNTEFYSVQDLAVRYNISESSAYNLLKRNRLTAVRIGALIRVPRAAIEQWEARMGSAS